MASGSDPGGDRSPREGIVSKLETCLGAAARKRTIGVANTLRAESGSLAAAVEGARIQQHSRSGRVPNLLAHIGRCVLGGQIVDARDPLFYYSEDLASYARELDSETRTLILLNKADLVPGEVRRQWASYFESKGLGYAFWSAKHSTDESAEFDKPEEDSRMRVLGATELLDLLESLRPPSKVCTLFLNRQADFANVHIDRLDPRPRSTRPQRLRRARRRTDRHVHDRQFRNLTCRRARGSGAGRVPAGDAVSRRRVSWPRRRGA